MTNNSTEQLLALEALSKYSTIWGQDLDLVQGQGGNSSYKKDNVLYIKASGKRLSEAQKEDVFVRCDLQHCLKAFAAGNEEDAKESTLDDNGLRPSIETLMHAILPSKYVLHFHCVHLLAFSAMTAGQAKIAVKIKNIAAIDIKISLIGYKKPGLPLAQAIHAKGIENQIFVLNNHGIVIQADSIEAIQNLLGIYLAEFAHSPNIKINDIRQSTQIDENWVEFSGADISHVIDIITNYPKLRTATFYPDHAVVLGSEIASSPADNVSWYIPDDGRKSVLVRSDKVQFTFPMIECLIRVYARFHCIESGFRALSRAEVDELVNWDAEKYRIRFNR